MEAGLYHQQMEIWADVLYVIDKEVQQIIEKWQSKPVQTEKCQFGLPLSGLQTVDGEMQGAESLKEI